MNGVYKGFFTYNKGVKIPESIILQIVSYDTCKAEVFGYGENEDFGYFFIQGLMDIEYIEDFDNLIFFELFNNHLEDEEIFNPEDDVSPEELEMR